MADAPLPPPRFRQARVLTSNERNRKAEKERATWWLLPPEEEVQWHMARIRGIKGEPSVGELLAFLTVALSYPEAWTPMVCALPWLWRHSVKDATRWRVWNYFCNRLPVIKTNVSSFDIPGLLCLSRTLRGGWKHGISLMEKSYQLLGRQGKDRVTEVNVALHFAGHLANCGPDTPASVKIHHTFFLNGEVVTKVSLSWNEQFQYDRSGHITKLDYVCYSKNWCHNCKQKGILSDINVRRGSPYYAASTKKYLYLCQTCKYANYIYPGDKTMFTTRGGEVTNILLEVLTEEQMQADALLRRYEALLYDNDFALPQRQWVKKKKPPPPSAEVLAEREAERKRKEVMKRREAAKERKRKAKAREQKREVAAEAKLKAKAKSMQEEWTKSLGDKWRKKVARDNVRDRKRRLEGRNRKRKATAKTTGAQEPAQKRARET